MHGALAAISSKLSALQAIQALGLTTGLQLCLDAGDENSYSSGQVWNDRSGNSYHFNLGTTSGAEASDPTFNGTVGQLSSNQYWSFDGGDFFTLGQANPTWVNNVHKNNALVAFAMWVQLASLSNMALAGTNNANTSDVGFQITVNGTTGFFRFGVTKASAGNPAKNIDSTNAVPTGSWAFIGIRVDEASDSAVMQLGGTQETLSAAYSSPSTSSASHVMQVANAGLTVIAPPTGSRMAMFNAWEGTVPTAANLLSFYNLTRGRFGV